ncbi:MAG: thiamine-phosphate kinase [Deltaproteobacteria bacterium]|nr:thiamine-phosphate kinase [Deltaproteobacteria bacterium]
MPITCDAAVASGHGTLNEFTLIERLVGHVPRKAEGLTWGVGDDCAVLTAGGRRDWLVSTECHVEGVHFHAAWMSWRQIGQRAVLATVSDVAAMGGRPRFLNIGVGIPDHVSVRAVEECYAGIQAAAEALGMVIIGGDTTTAPAALHLSMTVIGEVTHGRALYRRGARPGDFLYVTGSLGASALGLQLLQEGKTPADHPAIVRHREPPQRIEVAQWLASTGCVTAMIDISDGLLADAEHVAAASHVGMVIEGMRIPCAECLNGMEYPDPLHMAVTSGEEYELLFTVSGQRAPAFHHLANGVRRTLGVPLTRIGTVHQGHDVALRDASGKPVTCAHAGYEHQFTAS